ncbi:MAG: deoxyribodipyrimidine photo-lyase [Crocinitomicaceae bacterium]|nr:deoxyribodipyrimidine photo-lyase [Crocinitomicaceae bacterium]
MKVSVFWFRRDLRTEDNVALSKALESGLPILPIFIFDENILEELPKDDPRVNFIYNQLEQIHQTFQSYNSGLKVLKSSPEQAWNELADEFDIAQVFFNKDYEPYAIKRDMAIIEFLENKGIQVKSFKDQVIFEENDILKDDGKPYTIYTPYKNKWLQKFRPSDLKNHEAQLYHLYPQNISLPERSELGIVLSPIKVRPFSFKKLESYADTRNFPIHSTSDLAPHLRFGTVSIRQVIRSTKGKSETYLSELIWREFFMQILYHFPKSVNNNFKSQYDRVQWRNDEADYERWCNGQTGYPLVDAGMRELNETGYMHNRVRMVVASFLCKDLLIDWRWGEAYFARKLLDFELSSNVGNWQWAAGTGCDAAPYFRIFNPTEQLKKFDREYTYTLKWVPEMNELTYPTPIVEHKMARERCLKAYSVVKG